MFEEINIVPHGNLYFQNDTLVVFLIFLTAIVDTFYIFTKLSIYAFIL